MFVVVCIDCLWCLLWLLRLLCYLFSVSGLLLCVGVVFVFVCLIVVCLLLLRWWKLRVCVCWLFR